MQTNNNAWCKKNTMEKKKEEEEEEEVVEEEAKGDELPQEPPPPVEEEEPSREPSVLEETKEGELGGSVAPTLLDEKYEEALSVPIVLPTEKKATEKKRPRLRKKPQPPRSHKALMKELENHPDHLPFYTHTHYDRKTIIETLTRVKAMRGLTSTGRYYIENDWKHSINPWMENSKYMALLKADEKKRKKFSTTGRVNRIVDAFMDEVLNWECSREMSSSDRTSGGSMTVLWLGRSLAQKVINEYCIVKDVPKIFDEKHKDSESRPFFIVNRIPMDIFFSDKEALFGMLRSHMIAPGLPCRGPFKHQKNCISIEKCEKMERDGAVSRRVCVHQNLSLSLKPCLVESCPNYKRMPCEHLYVYLPETITINSYSSMLHFTERFQRVEDLKGCVFITKPAYLSNARGIKFFTQKSHFEHFYHMTRGKSSTRHGVLLQRYIECPRLFNNFKFTVRFFILVIVLPKRRVVGFIHYGIAFFAKKPYEPVVREDFDPNEEEKEGRVPDAKIPVNKRSIGRVVTTQFDPKVHFTNYMNPKERKDLLHKTKKGTAKILPEEEENASYISTILPNKCENSIPVYVQMLFVAQCMLDYMQGIIQDYVGTFQVIAVDTIIDARNKLWVLGASTNIFSSMMTLKVRQRHMMSAIIQETIGVTVECFYKTRNNIPLYWDYKNNRSNYETFFFTQDFNFFYETDRTAGYIAPKRQSRAELRLEERFNQVDAQFAAVAKRKAENMEEKRRRVKERLDYLAKVKAKHEEES